MPNITVPARLNYAGGVLRTRRLVPARLRYVVGMVMNERSTALGSGVAVPDLDRLTMADRLPGESEAAFMRRATMHQTSMTAIEDALFAVNARVDDLAAVVSRLTANEQFTQAVSAQVVAVQQTVSVVQNAVQETFADIDPTYGNEFGDRVSLQ